MDKKLYVAYGSNLNIRQMAYRCPGAKVHKIGLLRDYELAFCTHLTIEPKAGAATPVALWEIDAAAERALDRYEGFPVYYRKETITVETDTGPVEAMVYIMNNGKPALPCGAYYETVAVGYHEIGLDLTYLEEALKRTRNKVGK